MRTFLLVLLFFVYLLTVSALGIAAHGAPIERWVPAVRDVTVCGPGVVVLFGLEGEPLVGHGLVTEAADVVDIFVSDETPPLNRILDKLYWRSAKLADSGKIVYGPLNPNTGRTRCLVEARDV